MKTWQKLFTAALVLTGTLLVCAYGIGWYLAPQDDLEQADLIIAISGGETGERVKEAASLYKDGWSGTILFSGAALEGTTSNAQSMRRQALKNGVLPEDIIIEESATNTIENAKFTLEEVQELGAKKVILVTSPYHQRRASISFERIYPDDIEIIDHSAKDSSWRRKAWWTSRWAFNITVSEILKIIYLTFNSETP